MAAQPKSPLDHALDLVVFAPVGLALTAKDELPGLIEKGRRRLGSQVLLARMLGQFAAVQGQRAAARLVEQMTTAAGRLGGLPPTVPAPAAPGARGAGHSPATAATSPNGLGTRNGNGTERSSDGVRAAGGSASSTSARPAASPPAVDSLAIPGYDSLAASQVVQRLAGLSGPELEAVRRYELAVRGRRTILSKVAQLQAERSTNDPAPRS